MEFRTIVNIPAPTFQIEPLEEMLFVGSCFADRIGQRFLAEHFRAVVNPYGTMYNPVSVLHSVQRFCEERREMKGENPFKHVVGASRGGEGFRGTFPRVVFVTLGTNHVYRLKETGEIVDNCQKRPQRLFSEEELSVDTCVDVLRQLLALLRAQRPDVQVVFTVSPIRYQKYGFHESQLSKATLLLAVNQVLQNDSTGNKAVTNLTSPLSPWRGVGGEASPLSLRGAGGEAFGGEASPLSLRRGAGGEAFGGEASYFPAYEIVLDELRDYRFYQEDMLHPSVQAVEYIWETLVEHYFSPAAKQFLQEWRPIKEALGHRPFHPESEEYQAFLAAAKEKEATLLRRYGL